MNTTLTLYNCCFYISKSLNRLGRRIVWRGRVDRVVHEEVCLKVENASGLLVDMKNFPGSLGTQFYPQGRC